MGVWERVKEKIVEYQGDISLIEGIPQYIKDIYKTSFTTSPFAFIEIAARAQKWIDQALSRNMYLETRDIDETMNIYTSAWEKGLKTTYYLHMKPRHSAEQSTIAVNKAQKIGKVGFAGISLKTKGEEVVKPVGFSAPLQKSINEITPVVPNTQPVSNIMSGIMGVAEQKISKPVEDSAKINFVSTPQPVKVEDESEEKELLVKVGNSITTCPIDPAERAQCDACQ